MYTNNFWNKYNKNIYSSQGEDGIIEELLNRLNIKSGWVCEFGAWDGIKFSNTFNLIKSNNFKGVYIEGDKIKFNDLLKTVSLYKNIIPINEFVSPENNLNCLDNILAKTDIPNNFDILSIDVDSYDYHIWKSLQVYKPKIVIVEINSSVMTNNELHIHEENKYQGTGFRPMFKLGIEKGYKFVLHTGNMIFIQNELFPQLNINYNNELENFRTNWGGK